MCVGGAREGEQDRRRPAAATGGQREVGRNALESHRDRQYLFGDETHRHLLLDQYPVEMVPGAFVRDSSLSASSVAPSGNSGPKLDIMAVDRHDFL